MKDRCIMRSTLAKLTDTVKTYVEMASSLFDLDVDINDEHLARVAGTGRFNKRIGKPIYSEGNVSKHVLSTGQYLYVANPGSDPICATCPNLSVCNELSELCYPIVLQNKVLGTITIASSNKQQKEHLDQNFDRILGFMASISELIAMKVFEYQSREEQQCNLNLQYQLMNLINECVMIMSPDKKEILYCNMRTEKVLGFKLEQLKYFKKLGKFSMRRIQSRGTNTDEYILRIKNESIRLIGTSYPVEGMHRSAPNQVFILSDAKLLNESNYSNELSSNISFSSIIGKSPAIKAAIEKSDQLAYDNSPVLLLGEDGTGKSVFAQAIHNQSLRRNKPFVNSVFFFDEMLKEQRTHGTSTLHGGWTENMHTLLGGGTLYVPELSELHFYDQEVILKLIQRRLTLDVKVICASSLKLETLADTLRADLYTFLRMFSIKIPALRERGNQDIQLFLEYYLKQYNSQLKKMYAYRRNCCPCLKTTVS